MTETQAPQTLGTDGCTQTVNPATGALITYGYPCGKRPTNPESGLCARHHRAAERRAAQEQAARESATRGQILGYAQTEEMLMGAAERLVTKACRLSLARGVEPHITGRTITEMTARLQRAHRQLVAAEAELREVARARDEVIDRRDRSELRKQAEEASGS